MFPRLAFAEQRGMLEAEVRQSCLPLQVNYLHGFYKAVRPCWTQYFVSSVLFFQPAFSKIRAR